MSVPSGTALPPLPPIPGQATRGSDEPSFDAIMAAAASEASAETYDAAPPPVPPLPPVPSASPSRQGGARRTVAPPGFAARAAVQTAPKTGIGHLNSGVVGGALTMLVAVAWFVVGIMFLNRIFFYPPIMFIIGLVAMLKGFTGG
jgi:hypothetical protein